MLSPPQRLLFVYGTLMRGEVHHSLLDGCPFLGVGRTLPAFLLVDCGAYPALVATGSTTVVGELYGVDPDTLAALDELEGHPRLYRRQPIPLSGGTTAEAYLMDPTAAAGLPPIPSGDWRRR